MVKDVEELRAQLQIEAFINLCILGHGEIEVGVAGAENGITAKIAEGSLRWLREGVGIEVSGERIPVGQNGVHAGHDVGALVEVETAGSVVHGDDGNGTATLDAGNPVQSPAGAERLGQDMPVGQFIVGSPGEAVTSVEGRRAALGRQVVGILGKSSAGSEIDAVGGV